MKVYTSITRAETSPKRKRNYTKNRRGEKGANRSTSGLFRCIAQMSRRWSQPTVELSRTECVNIRYQVIPILGLFQTAESHFRAGNVFLGVLEVFELVP